MKRGTLDHPKVYTLAAILNIPRWGAAGLLESLWHFAQQYAHAGDIGWHTDEAIARYVEWTDSAATLISALVQAGWVDRCPCHRLRIHDWQEHADQGVERYLTDRNQWFCECYPRASSKRASRKPTRPLPCRAVSVAVAEPAGAKPAPAAPPPSPPDLPLPERTFEVLDGGRVSIETTGNPPGFDRSTLTLEAWQHIREIAAATGEEPAKVLERCSLIPRSRYYLLPHQLETAKPEHLMRTAKRLRDEAEAQRAKVAPPSGPSEAVLSRILTSEQARERALQRRREAQEADSGRASGRGLASSGGEDARESADRTRAARSDPSARGDKEAAESRGPPAAERTGVQRADEGAASAAAGNPERRKPGGVRTR